MYFFRPSVWGRPCFTAPDEPALWFRLPMGGLASISAPVFFELACTFGGCAISAESVRVRFYERGAGLWDGTGFVRLGCRVAVSIWG